MSGDPYTRKSMDAARMDPETRDEDAHEVHDPRAAGDPRDMDEASEASIDALHAQAIAAVNDSANLLRTVRERYRAAYNEELTRWQAMSDELDALERRAPDSRPRLISPDDTETTGTSAAGAADSDAADSGAQEAGAEDARVRILRSDVGGLGRELGSHQTELAKLEIAVRNLESTWVFLKRRDASLVGGENLPTELQMRIVEAQESERSRLAQEIHDGPAQVLSNAIFQVEYIERVIDHDDRLARTELRFLRELLRRELGSVRTFISQLRPPVLDELGLDGAIADAVGRTTALTGLAITTELAATSDRLTEAQQTVVLRVVQEALQNVRKHGGASSVIVASVIDGEEWVLTVRDDGRGFDVGAVAARGRRNFGLQFMQERAELIGAHFEVHSQPDDGTIVRLAIPMGT
jgi:two-component system, NarL family, sensor histidine kinase DegS